MPETQQHLLAILLTHPDFSRGILDGSLCHQELDLPALPMTNEEIYAQLHEAVSCSSGGQTEGVPALYVLGMVLGMVEQSYLEETRA